MDQKDISFLDIDLGPHDIQALNDSKAISAFFARLRYNTNVHIIQSPGNLGINAEGIVRSIKNIELIADQDGLFQVYLFELTSVTVGNILALGKAFRNRAGNYLLVLTSDYERLDFVVLEKYLPPGKGSGIGASQKQVGIRPRVLTIERRKPSRIHLRVIRRFTWTESDPFAQYDKLLSAYTVAEWSEEFFNNRALFSDYYLLERLRGFSVWAEDPKPSYLRLLELYHGAAVRFVNTEKASLKKELLEPVFKKLGFQAIASKNPVKDVTEPDYRLFSLSKGETTSKDLAPLALCLVYPWNRFLDGKDDLRDKENPDDNPSAIVVSLLDKGESPWVILTNGKLWRLYAQQAHSRATNYYEVDIEEILAQAGPHIINPAESFRYFWLFFRAQAFRQEEFVHEGKKRYLSLLDQLFLESNEYAKELGKRLKERVFEEIFPYLASGFITHIRQNGIGSFTSPDSRNKLQGAISPDSFPEEILDAVFQGTLTLFYRLLFLLYAEARDLLPVKEVRGYYEESLTKMKREIAGIAKDLPDGVEKNIKNGYHENHYELYDRLLSLFKIVDNGNPSLNVPVYNGGLFLSDPAHDDDSMEAQVVRFLNTTKVPDRFLAHSLDLLTRDVDSKRHDLVFIDYKSLGVRQLGSIYEGLLEFKLRIAARKLAVVNEKGRDVYKTFRNLDTKEQEKAERHGRVIKKGQIYLENDKSERKASGSYYTPDHIVNYIVENAVGSVLEEKFDSIRPKLRDVQQRRRAFFQKQEALQRQGIKPEPASKAEFIGQELVNELFAIKVLDPAMGSGHFLVEAVDYVTDKSLHFLNSFPWNPIFAYLGRMRETILQEMENQGITIDVKRLTDINLLKRHILKRCIYGVDLNPMAVELAKVSLWLDCFTLGAPLSFLDHHLRCGNSLIGVAVKEVKQAVEPVTRVNTKTKVAASATEWKTIKSRVVKYTLFGSRFAGLLLATDLMRHVGELSDVTSAQVHQSRNEYRKASDALAPFKRILDVYTSQWFGNETKKQGKRKASAESPFVTFLKKPEAEAFITACDKQSLNQAREALSPEDRQIVETALEAKAEKKFFHWELEFPEVFYGPRPGTTQAIERKEGAGFDAVIGNPPYDVLASQELGYDISKDLTFYETTSLFKPAIRGKKNLYKLFICRGSSIMGQSGAFSFIVPMALLGDDQAVGVRRLLLEKTRLIAIESFPQKDDRNNRVFFEAKLPTTIFISHAKSINISNYITIRTHPGKFIDINSPKLNVVPTEILAFDPENAAIPSCTQKDWKIVIHILASNNIRRMRKIAKSFQGEVNETNERSRGTLTDEIRAPITLRGSNICLYAVREPSQGEEVRIDRKKFLAGKKKDAKAFAFEKERVGFQRKSPLNNFRRIIAAHVPKGNFCIDSVSYIIEEYSEVDLDLLLALLNSKILDWYFRLGSTNSMINEYQVNSLPVPAFAERKLDINWKTIMDKGQWDDMSELLCSSCTAPGLMTSSVVEALIAMCRRIQEIEEKRILKNRTERSHLDPASQPIQDAIDAVLFKFYGLSKKEAQYINQRLKEML